MVVLRANSADWRSSVSPRQGPIPPQQGSNRGGDIHGLRGGSSASRMHSGGRTHVVGGTVASVQACIHDAFPMRPWLLQLLCARHTMRVRWRVLLLCLGSPWYSLVSFLPVSFESTYTNCYKGFKKTLYDLRVCTGSPVHGGSMYGGGHLGQMNGSGSGLQQMRPDLYGGTDMCAISLVPLPLLLLFCTSSVLLCLPY